MTAFESDLPHNLYTAAGVRELDHIAISEKNIPGAELMERAGQAAFDVLRFKWPQARKITVICGAGNNGGDGYIVARLSHQAELDVNIIHIGDVTQLKGDAKTAAEKCQAVGLQAQTCDPSLIRNADVVVDALLGTGLDRELDTGWQSMIEDINRQATAILSLDIPSGLHADTGMSMNVAVKADATVTFIGMKQGLLTAQGAFYCGELSFADLDVPAAIYAQVPPSARRIDLALSGTFLQPRQRHTHKGQCGHVLIIGGDYGYAGAVRMAGEAAMRTGAGLVTIATRPEHALNIPLARPELMTCAVNSSKQLGDLLEKASVIVIGPGLGQSDWATDLLARALQSKQPLVIDADALNLLASEPAQKSRWVLTPHPGEAARLLACSASKVQADRFAAVHELQVKYGGVCVLKGSGSLVIDENKSISICSAGNPGMASGGMGDVLSGVIAALIAQGIDLADAARVGVCLHSEAADKAAVMGERGMLASDLMAELRILSNPGSLSGY